MKIPLPKPTTLDAYLTNASGKATKHEFLETRECTVDGPAYEFIYRCKETGAERRWGVIDRVEFIDETN